MGALPWFRSVRIGISKVTLLFLTREWACSTRGGGFKNKNKGQEMEQNFQKKNQRPDQIDNGDDDEN